MVAETGVLTDYFPDLGRIIVMMDMDAKPKTINIKKNAGALKRFLGHAVPPMPDELVERVVSGFVAYWKGEIDWQDLQTLAERTSINVQSLKGMLPWLAIRMKLDARIRVFAEIDGWNVQGERIFSLNDEPEDAEAHFNDLVDDSFRLYLDGKIKAFKVVIVGESWAYDALDPEKKASAPDQVIGSFERPTRKGAVLGELVQAKAKSGQVLAGYC